MSEEISSGDVGGWAPVEKGGASFKTHKLNTSNPGKWMYEPSGFSKVFPWFFILIGGFMAVFLFFTIIMILPGLLFVFIGFYIRKRMRTAIVFDFQKRLFYRGKLGELKLDGPNEEVIESIPLDEVQAIQVLAEEVESSSNTDLGNSRVNAGSMTYTSFELNLVLNNMQRINVIDHGYLKTIKQDAEALSKRLNVPLLVAENLKPYFDK